MVPRIMEKILVNEDQYIAVMNEELKKHPLFEIGMEIIGVPEGYSGGDLSGYNHKGPESKMPSIVHEVSTAVGNSYTLVLTKRI